MKKMLIILFIVLTIVVLVLYFLPNILSAMGLHPSHPDKTFNLSGKKALIINTNQEKLDPLDKMAGLFSSEMTVPYYEFLDAGMQVDLASIKGGLIPIDPMSTSYPIATHADKRMLKDKDLLNKVKNSLNIADIDFLDYDIIFFAGGWGASYDLGYSELLGEKVTEANKAGKVLGGVCHGPLGLIKAKKENGEPLLKDKRVTAVTDKQVKELGITVTPLHPESEIRKLGAIFESTTAFKDIFANYVVKDGNLITGQNQNAGKEVAQKMMENINK